MMIADDPDQAFLGAVHSPRPANARMPTPLPTF